MNKFLEQRLNQALQLISNGPVTFSGGYHKGFIDAVELLWPCVNGLKRANKFVLSLSEWDSSFPEGVEIEPSVWIKIREMQTELQEALKAIGELEQE